MAKDNSNIILLGSAIALGAIVFSSSDKKSSTQITTKSPGTKLSPTDFIKKYYADAKKSQLTTGVPALVTLAQGGLESMWGQKAFGNNFFGVKASSKWKGATQELKTWECSKTGDTLISVFQPNTPGSNANCNSANKPSYRVLGKFRAYATPSEGFEDHGRFLMDNSRYKNAFKYKHDPIAFALEIAKAGYATAPNYGTILVNTINNIKKVL